MALRKSNKRHCSDQWNKSLKSELKAGLVSNDTKLLSEGGQLAASLFREQPSAISASSLPSFINFFLCVKIFGVLSSDIVSSPEIICANCIFYDSYIHLNITLPSPVFVFLVFRASLAVRMATRLRQEIEKFHFLVCNNASSVLFFSSFCILIICHLFLSTAPTHLNWEKFLQLFTDDDTARKLTVL